jgi:hypothetical protein
MSADSIEFSIDHQLWDYMGVQRQQITGTFTRDTLVTHLTAEWVPFYECHKCGRADYCKHVEWIGTKRQRSRDIQCGVVVAAIRNIVDYSFHLLVQSDARGRQSWLDGAYHLVMFVHKAELQIGNLIDTSVLEFWEDHAPVLFGHLTRLREHLDGVASEFSSLPAFRSTESVLFVEGWSEKAFIDRMRESRSIAFLYKHIEVYGGSGNRRPKRIQMLLEKYTQRGFEIYFQGDADGKEDDWIQALVDRCGIKKDHMFSFVYDFESAIPPGLLFAALQSVEKLEGVTIDEFRPRVTSARRPVGHALMEFYGLDIRPLKMELATVAAEILNASHDRWWSDTRFLETELGRFLLFVQRI